MNTLPVKAAVGIISGANKIKGNISPQALESAIKEVGLIVNNYQHYNLEEFKLKLDALGKILPETAQIREDCISLFNNTIVISNKAKIENYNQIIDYIIDNPDINVKKAVKYFRQLQKDSTNHSVRQFSSKTKGVCLIIICISFFIAVIKKPTIIEHIAKIIAKTIATICKAIVKIIELIIEAISNR